MKAIKTWKNEEKTILLKQSNDVKLICFFSSDMFILWMTKINTFKDDNLNFLTTKNIQPLRKNKYIIFQEKIFM